MSDQSGYTPPTPPEPPAPAAPPPAAAPAPDMSGRPAPASDTSKLLAAAGYLVWIVALIAILIDPYKDEKYVRFHAIQALGWTCILFLMVLSVIPFIGWIVSMLVWLTWLIGGIMWAVKAYNGEYNEVPVIYGIVKNYIGE